MRADLGKPCCAHVRSRTVPEGLIRAGTDNGPSQRHRDRLAVRMSRPHIISRLMRGHGCESFAHDDTVILISFTRGPYGPTDREYGGVCRLSAPYALPETSWLQAPTNDTHKDSRSISSKRKS